MVLLETIITSIDGKGTPATDLIGDDAQNFNNTVEESTFNVIELQSEEA